MSLMYEMNQKALELGVPISVHLDVSYRCNERCVHCYLDHDDHGEMTLAEMRDVLDQMAEAGVFFLTISGGEVLMRMDFFDILAHARARMFSVKLKTNAFMIRAGRAGWAGAGDRGARAGSGVPPSGAGGGCGGVLRAAARGGRRCAGLVSVQRRPYRLLHLSLRRSVSLRAVSAAQRERAEAEISG